jgi:NADH-quinone oxidoreductase subunit M
MAAMLPRFTTVFFIFTLGAMALPGTNGFIGEFLILLGSWKVSGLWTGIATLGVVLGAVYSLRVFQTLFLGPVIAKQPNEKLSDLSFREGLVLLPLVILVFCMGLQSSWWTRGTQSSVQSLIDKTNLQSETKVISKVGLKKEIRNAIP